MKVKSLKYNSILNAFRMLISVLVPLITFPYTSRIFLTEGSGTINFVTSTTQIFTMIASLGIYSYGIREGAKIRDNKELFSRFTTELFTLNLIATFVTYVVFFLFVFRFSRFIEHQNFFLIYGLTIGFTALGLDWLFGANEEYIYITIRQIFVQIFIIASMFVFVHSKKDIELWIFILTLSIVIPNIYNFIHARKYFRFVQIRPYDIVKHLKPIIILFATTVASKVYSNIDVFLLGIMSTNHSVGLYSAAIKVNTILITFLTAMTPVFIPRVVHAIARKDKDEYYIVVKKVFSCIVSVSIPAVIGLIVLGKEIIYVIAGSAFEDSHITIRILAPIVLIASCANIIYYVIFVPKGKELTVLKCTIIGAISNLVISSLLIPTLNENGAAIGSLIAELIAFSVSILFCNKQNNGFIVKIQDIKNYLYGGLAVLFCCLCTRIVFNNPLIILFLSISLSGIVYLGILILSKDYIGTEMSKLFRKILGKLLWRNQ